MPTPRPPQPSKKDVLTSLLAEGKTRILLDARAPGVDVPGDLRDNPGLVLNLSTRFPRPLFVEEDQVIADLSFGGSGYRCVVPYSAIFCMSSYATRKQFVWPEDVPLELMDGEGSGAESDDEQTPSDLKTRRARPAHLKVVPAPADAPMEEAPPAAAAQESPPASDPPPDPSPPRRGHLRLVK